MSFNFFNNKATKFILLMSFCIFLVACQNLNTSPANDSSSQEAQADIPLPKVEPKYSQEEISEFQNRVAAGTTARYEGLVVDQGALLHEPDKMPASLYYDSGINIPYPKDGVRGVYLTAANVANPEYFDYIIKYIEETELNTVVIDFKDDWGNIIPTFETDNELIQANMMGAVNMQEILKVLEEKQIYPIARIVTFKDNLLSDLRPDLSFADPATGGIWQDAAGSQFINPFLQETWDYNLEIAAEAAKMGFKEIQFDYIRFPEGFQDFADDLEYNMAGYSHLISEDPDSRGQERVAAINDFLEYADNYLAPYGVDISADIFGYTAIAGNAPDVRGIGQNFASMAERVDTVSSMIYPSHWDFGFFGLDYPDLYPYELINRYMQEEDYVLDQVDNRPNTRPWLQDFTASYLAPGTWITYGPNEVQVQINALYENGVREYLLWNAVGEYTEGVDYSPDIEPITDEERQAQQAETESANIESLAQYELESSE